MRTSEDLKRSVAADVAACILLLTPLHLMAGPTTEWTVSGTVVDSIHGHPLSATIEVPGTGINPVEVGPDGQYSIDLPESQAFELMTTAVFHGYDVSLTTVGPLTEDTTVIIQVEPDLAACEAPGYFKDQTTYHSETFETDNGGYTTDTPGNPLPWEWGTPTDWPNDCKVGSNCWGTNLGGDFSNFGHEHLTSGMIDLSAATNVDGLTLYWDQAWDLFSSSFHDASVESRIDGVINTIWQSTVTESRLWNRLSADVMAAAGMDMTVRWSLNASGTSSTSAGLYVDNVRVVGYQCQFDELPPVIDLAPPDFDVQMFPDENHSVPLAISNFGDQGLDWNIQVRDTTNSASMRNLDGYYDPANWTLIDQPEGTGGFIDVQPGPPTELYIMGGDEGVVGYTELQITIPRDGEVSFDWGFQTPVSTYSDAGFLINDNYTSLADTFTQVNHFEETENIPVEAGDVFGFRVQAWQGYSGPAEFGITNFDAPTCETPASVSWLDLSVDAGSVNASDSVAINLEFDTNNLLPGTYETMLCVISNDPLNPVLFVPVMLTVQAPAHYGTITGQIDSLGYCSNDPGPGSGAGVEVAGSNQIWNINADENGEYFIQIDSAESPIDVTASLPGYIDGIESALTLAAGATEVVNFDLLLSSSCAETDPQDLAMTVAQNGMATEQLAIQNLNGATPLSWSTFLHEPSQTSPASESALAGAGFSVPAFSTTSSPNQGYVTFDVLDPGTFTQLNAASFTSLTAGAFVDNNFSEHLLLHSDTHKLISLDTQTGSYTEVGTITGADTGSTTAWLSMSWDHATNTLYAVRWDGNDAVLFSIDIAALEATEIGTIEGPELTEFSIVVAIAVDFSGQMYGIDTEEEILLEIDKHTGQATSVGSLGFDMDTAVQDIDFDHSENKLYWARVPLTGGQTEMMSIDTVTGAATYIADIDGGSSLLSMSIAMPTSCVSPDAVGWLDVLSSSGTIDPGDQEIVQVAIDADGLAVGTHEAQICIDTDDPRRLLMAVPVTLEVAAIDPPDINVVPTSLSTSLADDETDTLVFSIGNQGEQRLDWSVDETPSGCALPGWVDVNPGSGSINQNSNMAVFVDIDATGLSPAVYNTTVCIENNDPAEPLAEVDLQLTVVERALGIDKSLIDAPDPIIAGSTLQYRIEATNTGGVALENVIVNDSQINPSTNSCSNLPVSQTCLLEGAYTVTSDDMDVGVITNIASASADGVTQITVEHREIVDEEIFADRYENP